MSGTGEPTRQPLLFADGDPGTIKFTIHDKAILTIEPGGKVIVSPDSDLDEASRLFWRCVVDLGWRHGIDVLFDTEPGPSSQ